jgi:general stress protein 26
MTHPVTELDHRFSDPDTKPTDWDATKRALEDAQLSWITTVRADGRPHVTPVVAIWLEDHAYFTTGATEQKAINLDHNPAVVLTTGCNTWDRGTDTMIEGHASRVTDTPTLQKLASAWAQKWEGQWQYEPVEGGLRHAAGGTALVFQVTPNKVLAFGKGTFTHTRHVMASDPQHVEFHPRH